MGRGFQLGLGSFVGFPWRVKLEMGHSYTRGESWGYLWGHTHKDTAPGEADERVPGCQPGVVPPHATILVQQQGKGAAAISGEHRLVRVGLGNP